jgi:hypothetical protein
MVVCLVLHLQVAVLAVAVVIMNLVVVAQAHLVHQDKDAMVGMVTMV